MNANGLQPQNDRAGPLAQSLRDTLTQASDTRRVVVSPGALDAVAGTFVAAFGRRSAVVVADETTHAVAGQKVDRRLRDAGLDVVAPYVFPVPAGGALLHADYERAVRLGDALAQHDAIPIAVGAGTINDLTKLGALLAERPYMVVATAASMDGYAAFGAAITRDGYKQTIACPAPRAIVADVDVLAAAPPDMTASGLGDLLGKITAGADWLVADGVSVEPIDRAAWEMAQPAARRAAEPERLRERDPEAVERLFRCLIMCGLAMQAARSSRPASGAEHQLSHLWEMRGLRVTGADVSHGFKVGVGTVAVAALYERLLAIDLDRLDIDARCARWPSLEQMEACVRGPHVDPQLRDQALVESRAKYVTAKQLRDRLHRLQTVWPALRQRLRAQLLPAAEIRGLLRAAGCPSEPEEIGLTRAALRASFAAARQIRRRYTVLDLAFETGVLDDSLDALFRPDGTLSEASAAVVATAPAFRASSRVVTPAAPGAAAMPFGS